VAILRLWVKVTPKTIREVTQVMVESGGGGQFVDRARVTTISLKLVIEGEGVGVMQNSRVNG